MIRPSTPQPGLPRVGTLTQGLVVTSPLCRCLALNALALAVLSPPAAAAELVWDGYYRARGRFFDTLSLSKTNSYSEGLSSTLDNRARLQPGWLLSSKVGLFSQIDLLGLVPWGSDASTTEPFSGDTTAVELTETVNPPTDEEGGATLQNLRVTRLWAEINAPFGKIRFGRMPVEWGAGMVWNAGNDPLSEYGDTADRVQITSLIGPVYVIGAYELPYEGYLNLKDDLHSVVGGVLYQTETLALGTYHVYRWRAFDDDRFGAWIGDLWGRAELGAGEVELEVAGQLGGGDLDTGANDITISSFGALVRGHMPFDKLRVGLTAGFASGDGDPSDKKVHTFSFDRDYNLSLFLFEEPMPTLEATVPNATNGGRIYDAMRTGEGISNAIFAKPSIGWQFKEDLYADLSLFAAQAAKVSEDERDRKGYGLELNADGHYAPFDFFSVDATVGLLFPGSTFKNYEDETYGGDFNRPAFGVRLLGTVSF